MTWWIPLLQAGGSLLSSSMANNAADDMTDATNAATQQQLELAQQVYGDQRGLMMPAYLRGNDAANQLAALYGIAPQAYTGQNAFGGAGMYAGSAGGYGADGSLPEPISTANGGIPSLSGMITGHDPSIYNAISNGNISNEAWWAEGGPSMLGQALSSMFGVRGPGDGGSAVDQWGTPQDNATDAGRYDYAGYVNSNPDLVNAFRNLSDRDNRYARTAYDIDGDGRLSQAEYGQMHYEQHGQREGRTINPMTGQASTGASATGGTGATATGATGTASAQATDPMQTFYNSPDAKLAQDQFLNFDTPRLQSAFATQGKAISGAQQKALSDYGAQRLGNAFSGYKNTLGTLAGLGSSAGGQVAAAGSDYGATAGNAFANMGNANALNAQMRYQNQSNAFNNIGRSFGSQGWV